MIPLVILYIKRVQVTPLFYPRYRAGGLLMCIARLLGREVRCWLLHDFPLVGYVMILHWRPSWHVMLYIIKRVTATPAV